MQAVFSLYILYPLYLLLDYIQCVIRRKLLCSEQNYPSYDVQVGDMVYRV